jgi:DNA-binding transcriptional MerR regulator
MISISAAGSAVSEIGFSLREIKELLSLRVTAGKSCGDVRQRARQKITEIDHKSSLIQGIVALR